MPEDWGWPDVTQKAIGVLELLGQLALVILRCRLRAATVGQVDLHLSHLAGERNVEAALSRLNCLRTGCIYRWRNF